MTIITKNTTKTNILITIGILLVFCITSTIKAENLELKINLEGEWKFSIGDDKSWADRDYIDQDWDVVRVPGSWESNGYNDYNGFAWYRKEFTLQSLGNEKTLFMLLGRIDDVDEVYLNGKLIGLSGLFPPKVITAYDMERKYPFPSDLLVPGEKNVIAVRVYDEYYEGGICAGPIGIYRDRDNELLSMDLSGYWDFEPVLSYDQQDNKHNNETKGIYVPGFWESHGYTQLDGAAYYSTKFTLPSTFDVSEMILVMGYIDDLDKVYLNDMLIGLTEDLLDEAPRKGGFNEILRGYEIPEEAIIAGGQNTLKVKVYDTGGKGGIFRGPVGIITKNNFEILKRNQTHNKLNIWEEILNSLFE